jgi:hypothetical protein
MGVLRIGDAFDKGVSDSIELRQAVLAQSSEFNGTVLDPQSRIKYVSSRVPWVRLSSSVSVTPNSSKAQIFGKTGTELARTNVLEGYNPNNDPTDLAAGYQNTPQFGIRPKPGITQVSIKAHQRFGTLRTASVQFKCWSVEQLEIMDVLYMRPGYTVLLEFGTSTYVDSDGKVKTDMVPLNLYDNSKKWTKNSLLNAIETRKKDYNYQYDAIFGFVKNFSWSLNPDGSYECTTSIITFGEIIESLKSTFTFPSTANREQAQEDAKNSRNNSFTGGPIGSLLDNYYSEKTVLHYALTTLKSWAVSAAVVFTNAGGGNAQTISDRAEYLSLPKKEKQKIAFKAGKKVKDYADTLAEEGENIATGIQLSAPDLDGLLQDEITTLSSTDKSIPQREFKLDVLNTLVDQAPSYGKYILVSTNITDPSHFKQPTDRDPVYIKLDTFLTILNKLALKSGADNIVTFDIDESGYRRYRSFDLHFSVDPKVCFIPRSTMQLLLGIAEDFKAKDPDLDTPLIRSIWLNLDHILQVYDSNFSNSTNNEVSIYELVMSIMKDVQSALGQMNAFDIDYDEARAVYRIVDRNYIRIDPTRPKIELLGNKSIIRNVSLESKLSPKITTMIAISAQAGAESLGMEATAFSQLNEGLIDNIIPVKADFTSKVVPIEGVEEIELAGGIPYKVLRYYDEVYNLGRIVVEEDPEIVRQTYMEFINRVSAKTGRQASFVIPFELGFTLDGTSGMVIGSSFDINPNILPAPYKVNKDKAAVAFLLTGVEHTINPTSWTTSLRSQMFISEGKTGTYFTVGVADVLDTARKQVKQISSPSRDLTTTRAIEDLHPKFRDKITVLLTLLERDGLNTGVAATEWQPTIGNGYRSVSDQAQKYREGKSKVTLGFHNVVVGTSDNPRRASLAADIIDRRYSWNQVNGSYDIPAEFFKAVGKYAKQLGLEWGGDFAQTDPTWKEYGMGWDVAHVQYAGKDRATLVAEARKIHGLD